MPQPGSRRSLIGVSDHGLEKQLPNLAKPPLPPGATPGGHGGSHGHLGHEFVMSISENRKPQVDIIAALNMTVAGVVAHRSALKDGELTVEPAFVVGQCQQKMERTVAIW